MPKLERKKHGGFGFGFGFGIGFDRVSESVYAAFEYRLAVAYGGAGGADVPMFKQVQVYLKATYPDPKDRMVALRRHGMAGIIDIMEPVMLTVCSTDPRLRDFYDRFAVEPKKYYDHQRRQYMYIIPDLGQ